MRDLHWLTERPIAHRGLHGGSIVENTMQAAQAAANAGYGLECDIHLSADEEVVVFHDYTLHRLTTSTGRVREKNFAELRDISFRSTTDRIPSLREFLAAVAGRVPVLIEMKSLWSGDTKIAEKAAAIVSEYRGHCALMSFDPLLVRTIREIAPHITRGLVAVGEYREPEQMRFSRAQIFALGQMLNLPRTRPHYIAYGIRDIPAFAPLFARNILGLPLLTWTVRTEDERARARRWTDQMVFEGFRP
jgi:glycerophosphoryl diester phosphodiesterase